MPLIGEAAKAAHDRAIELSKTNLSGTRLLPGWREEEGQPFKTEVKDDQFLLLGPAGSIRLSNFAQEASPSPSVSSAIRRHHEQLCSRDAVALAHITVLQLGKRHGTLI